ncbi:hypothetical protein FNV58_00685 (plasmid) [Streptomyces sp. RLB1-9]|uniref:hypothetical protein n=1 Tax=Streptomyces sp. RLB1-9 TaxID=2594454 RepID=UPI0011659F44|nr:hypothetical protein [Streptomyces sp. RLB1-9]QDN94876.1 hypothetical protein FNV58_00685 [Streptomyces sp. RLB1-9]
MTSAAATESTSTELVPSLPFDFDKLGVELKNDPGLNISDVLARLATIPPIDPDKPVKMASVVELVTGELMHAIEEIPDVFGKVKPPASRRVLNTTELAKLRAEKIQIDTAMKALAARKNEIHTMVSVHFDVVAEQQKGIDPTKTPTNKKGHYLIASPGNPERADVKDGLKYFTREKAKDTVEWSMDALLDLLESGKITRAEFRAITSTQAVIDLDKVKRVLTLKSKMPRFQEIVSQISTVKHGTLSINLR